jgi:micrococcal nuclease
MYEYSAKIIRVVDGDTVDVDINLGFGVVFVNQRVRLYGIDTPESRTRDPIEKIFGKTASKFLTEKLGEKCTLRTRLDNKGKYGRVLGEFVVYDHETDSEMTVNNIMIRDHYAVEYFGQSKDDIEDEHLVNRDLLMEKLGLPKCEDGEYTMLAEKMGL